MKKRKQNESLQSPSTTIITETKQVAETIKQQQQQKQYSLEWHVFHFLRHTTKQQSFNDINWLFDNDTEDSFVTVNESLSILVTHVGGGSTTKSSLLSKTRIAGILLPWSIQTLLKPTKQQQQQQQLDVPLLWKTSAVCLQQVLSTDTDSSSSTKKEAITTVFTNKIMNAFVPLAATASPKNEMAAKCYIAILDCIWYRPTMDMLYRTLLPLVQTPPVINVTLQRMTSFVPIPYNNQQQTTNGNNHNKQQRILTNPKKNYIRTLLQLDVPLLRKNNAVCSLL